jgi:pimeloyl-ACP methyl ester carboxylesterase
MGDTELVANGDAVLFVRHLSRGIATGERPPVLVVHGGPDWDHAYLLPGLQPLARDHHVVAFDWRGCGRSSRDLPTEAYQPDLVVTDVRRLVEHLGVPQVDLVGFSTGGRIVQRFVAAHPELVRRLVLASTTAYMEIPSLDGWPEYQQRVGMQEDVEPDKGETYERAARDGAPTAIWDLGKMTAYQRLLDTVHWSGEWGKALAAGLLPPMGPTDAEEVLRAFGRPVLVLHGAQDMGFPVELARRLHEALPNSTLEVIDQAGHMVQFEHPEEWAGKIRAFLAA